MKIIIERDKFADAAAAALRSAGGATKIPILHNLLIKPNGKAVHIAGTQLDQQLETSCAAEIVESSEEGLTVPGSALVEFVNRLPQGAQIEIEWKPGKDPHATLRSGRARYKLLTLPSSDFPALLEPKEPAKFSMFGNELVAALNPIRFAMSRDHTRNNLRGIHVHMSAEKHPVFAPTKDKLLRFVACDGSNMAITTMPAGADEVPPFTLPDTTINEVLKLAGDAKDEVVEFAVSSNLFSMTANHKTFTTKLIGEEYAQYTRPIPTEFTARGVVDSDEIGASLARLLSISDRSRTKISISDGTLRMHLLDHNVGEANEEIEIGEWNGPDIERLMNARTLVACIESVKSDACLLQFVAESARSPVIIQPWRAGVADVTRTFLTMPME